MLALPGSQSEPRVRFRRMTNSNPRAAILQPTSRPFATIDPNTANNSLWAPLPGLKIDDTLCLGFQNLGGLPQFPSHHKNHLFRSFLSKYNFDIFGVAETNLNWSLLPAESQCQERIHNTWAKTHFSLAYNRTNNKRNPQQNKGQSLFQQHG
jgi:hypothetical protein